MPYKIGPSQIGNGLKKPKNNPGHLKNPKKFYLSLNGHKIAIYLNL